MRKTIKRLIVAVLAMALLTGTIQVPNTPVAQAATVQTTEASASSQDLVVQEAIQNLAVANVQMPTEAEAEEFSEAVEVAKEALKSSPLARRKMGVSNGVVFDGEGSSTKTLLNGQTAEVSLADCIITIKVGGSQYGYYSTRCVGTVVISDDDLIHIFWLTGEYWVYDAYENGVYLLAGYTGVHGTQLDYFAVSDFNDSRVVKGSSASNVAFHSCIIDGQYFYMAGQGMKKRLMTREEFEYLAYGKVPTTPTPEPTVAPTQEPTKEPTPVPTVAPTPTPTEEPTQAPTVAPTTEAPTPEPTEVPVVPTAEPTQAPFILPTYPVWPTMAPVVEPTLAPAPIVTQAPVPTLPFVMPTVEPAPVLTMAPAPTLAPASEQTLTPALPQATPNMVIDTSFEARWQEMFNIYAQWYEQYQQATSWQMYAQMMGIANWKEVEQEYWHEETVETTAPDGSKKTTTDGYRIGTKDGQASATGQVSASGTSTTVGQTSGALAATGSAAGSVQGQIHTEVTGTTAGGTGNTKQKDVISYSVKYPTSKKGSVKLAQTVNGHTGIICEVPVNYKKHTATYDGQPYTKVRFVTYSSDSKMILLQHTNFKWEVIPRAKGKIGTYYTTKKFAKKYNKYNRTPNGTVNRIMMVRNGKKIRAKGVANAQPKRIKR